MEELKMITITMPVTTLNLIISLLRSAKRHFHMNAKYISEWEAEKCADFLKGKVKEFEGSDR